MGVAPEPFGVVLRRFRARAGLTQEQLADRAGVSVKAISALERGERRHPYPHTVRALGGALGVSAQEFAILAAGVPGRGQRRELPPPDRPDAPRPVGGLGAPVAQLPADVQIFTGRERELAVLDRQLAATAHSAGAGGGCSTAVVISAVSGTAGVGKTALALRWAHRVRGEFPDGQLYVNLRGYDPDQPLAATDALAGFLRALGMAGQHIPLEGDERAAAYRSLLDGRRMLVVLDNASSVEQVRPLLPGSASCLVLVTSRDSLAGLVARHGARRLELDLLPAEDAVALLRALIGERVEVEPEAAAVLAGQCAWLPLALGVAAELAVTRPGTPLAALVAELADHQRRLQLLDAGGDPRTAVRAVFSWSYQHLPVEGARAFRLIGLHPGPDLDPYAAAALIDTSREHAQHLLDLLTRAHLIQSTSPGRYGMHDLLRAYAAHLATEDPENEWRAALTRLFDHYLTTAAAAMDIFIPAEQYRRPRIRPLATPSPPMSDPTTARAWLDAERATLLASTAYTAAHGWPGHTTALAATLFRYLDISGHYPDALVLETHARHAAHHSGDYGADARALTHLGIVSWKQSHYQQAAEYLQQALAICRETGDQDIEALALTHLGILSWQQGHYQQGAEQLEQALTLTREIGDRPGEALALTCLGLVSWQRGPYQQAAEHHQQALALFREFGDRSGEAAALTHLGVVYWHQGHYQQGAEQLEQALTLTREIGDRDIEALALTCLGLVSWRQGHYQQGANQLKQALTLNREIGDGSGEATALTILGAVCCHQGRYGQAAEQLQQALAICRELGDRSGEARALGFLGLVYRRQGHYQQATEHHQQALALFREFGDRSGEARALNGVGETLHATGQHREARSQHTAALTLATQLGDRYEQARAHNGIAHTYNTTGQAIQQARHHWHQALALYTTLGVPEAEDVHAHLATLDQTLDQDGH